ncbi:MAG: ribonuclease III [Selenomonadaceae bacterium]|nr:ribonuclease III [Selenomonadaceae bacterium]
MNEEFNFLNDVTAEEIQTLSPLVLAYIGDAYFHLYVRTRLLKFSHKINKLHEMSTKIVSAISQAEAYKKIEPNLTDKEKNFFRRGRNAKSHAPKSSTVAEYHASTGFETLLGELFLRKKFSRLDEICGMAFDSLTEF